MIRLLIKPTLLLACLLCFARLAHAQGYFEFFFQVPVVDSSNGNQWAVGQTFWIDAPNYPGSVGNASYGGVQSNGYEMDSIYVLGPGTGTLNLNTIDCHGDTLTQTYAFDSTMTQYVADTIFLCAATAATCAANFTANVTPGNPTVSFLGSYSGTGTLTSNDWSFGDGTYSNALNPTHTYVNSGSYYVSYQIVLSTGCTNTVGQNITITGGGTACSTSILPSQWGNATNFYVNYTASGIPIHFDWNFGDGGTLSTSANGILHNYASNGSYNVCVVTTFSDGCIDTTCQTVSIVLGGQGTCNAGFSYLVNGQSVAFADASTSSGSIQTWRWYFGDGSLDSTFVGFVSHTYSGPGPYVAHLVISTIDTCYSTAVDTIYLTPQGGCAAAFTHAPDTTGQYTILAYNTSTGNGLSYFWDFGDGDTSNVPYPIHQYAGAGTYPICLTVTQASPACTHTYCDSVAVTQKQAMAFTFAVFNPATAVVAPQQQGAGLSIAPQPVRERLLLRLPSQGDGTVLLSIYNAFGQAILDSEIEVQSGSAEWDASALPSGMYVVRIGAASARFWVMR